MGNSACCSLILINAAHALQLISCSSPKRRTRLAGVLFSAKSRAVCSWAFGCCSRMTSEAEGAILFGAIESASPWHDRRDRGRSSALGRCFPVCGGGLQSTASLSSTWCSQERHTDSRRGSAPLPCAHQSIPRPAVSACSKSHRDPRRELYRSRRGSRSTAVRGVAYATSPIPQVHSESLHPPASRER